MIYERSIPRDSTTQLTEFRCPEEGDPSRGYRTAKNHRRHDRCRVDGHDRSAWHAHGEGRRDEREDYPEGQPGEYLRFRLAERDTAPDCLPHSQHELGPCGK